MSNLVKQEEISFPAGVSKEHRQVITAAKQEPLRNMDEYTIDQFVLVQIDRAKNIAGYKSGDKEIDKATIEVVSGNIKSGKYGNITRPTFERAITLGASEELGEFHGINTRTINSWLRSVFKKEEAFRKVQAYHEAREKELSEQEAKSQWYKENQEKLMLDRMKGAYEKRKSGSPVWDLGGFFFQYLTEKGLIPTPHPKEKEFLENATRKEIEQKKQDLQSTRGFAYSQVKEQIKKIEKGQRVGDKTDNSIQLIKNQLILEAYFDDHIELGSEFEEII